MANKPSTETIKILKGISKNFDIEMSDIKKKFTKLLGSRAIQNLDVADPDRERHAVRILMAEITAAKDRSEFSGKVVPVVMRIESKEGISDFKRAGTDEPGYRAGLFVTMQDADENVALAKLTLWNDGCEVHPTFVVGETYATQCVIGNRGDIYDCSINDATEVEESDVVLKPLKDIIAEVYTPISIDDVENNISRDRDDLKLVEGVVVSGWSKVTANGRDMSFIKIMSETDFDSSFMAKFSGDANVANFVSAGDLVYILCQITPAVMNDDGSVQYEIGAWGSLLIPIVQAQADESDDYEDSDVVDADPENSEDDLEEKIADW